MKLKQILQYTSIAAASALATAVPANAASIGCGSGNGWVSTCQDSTLNFSGSTRVSVNFGFAPNNLPDFVATLRGDVGIRTSDPLDAIVSDPLLGNAGSADGSNDVVFFEAFTGSLSGPTPFVPFITSNLGDGVADLAPTPADETLPYESLYSAGALIQRQDDTSLADSFFNLFLEIANTPEGTIRNRDPLQLIGTSPLNSFPSALEFSTTALVPLFTPGADGVFWTGDEVEVARIVPDVSDGRSVVLALESQPVPEPSFLAASGVAGVALYHRRRRRMAS